MSASHPGPSQPLAERHARLAEGFTAVVDRVDDWDAPTPVPEWAARDVVDHLVAWSQGFLASGGVQLRREGDPDDPAASWRAHAAEVQELLESPAAEGDFTHPHLGTEPLGGVIDRLYTTDVLMHTWDLAESAGVPSGLDAQECEHLLQGMSLHEQILRDSGQYGPAVPVPPDADGVVRLMGFVGRDPEWRSGR